MGREVHSQRAEETSVKDVKPENVDPPVGIYICTAAQTRQK